MMEIGGALVRGVDIPNTEPMRSAYLTLQCDMPQKAEEPYYLLREGSEIFIKMEKWYA